MCSLAIEWYVKVARICVCNMYICAAALMVCVPTNYVCVPTNCVICNMCIWATESGSHLCHATHGVCVPFPLFLPFSLFHSLRSLTFSLSVPLSLSLPLSPPLFLSPSLPLPRTLLCDADRMWYDDVRESFVYWKVWCDIVCMMMWHSMYDDVT